MAERIDITELPVPVTLARAVLDPSGHVLLSAGSVVDGPMAEALRRSVAYVWVESEPGEAAKPDPGRTAAEMKMLERIGAMYARHQGNERMAVLERLSINHLVGRQASVPEEDA